jgi:ADP-ribosylglycohydrolase
MLPEKKETPLPLPTDLPQEVPTYYPLTILRGKIESIEAPQPLEKGRIADKLSAVTEGQAAGDALGVATNNLGKEMVMLGHRRGSGALDVEHPAFHPDLKLKDPILFQWPSKFPEKGVTDVTEQATLIIRAIDQHQKYPEKSLEILFAEQLYHWVHHGLDNFEGEYSSNEAQPLGSCRMITAVMEDLLKHKDFLKNPVKVALETWEYEGTYKSPASFQPVMRASVLGTIYYRDLTAVVEKTILFASVTEADPRSISSAVALSVAIALFLRGHDSVEEITHHSLDIAKIVLRDQMEQKASYYKGENWEELNDQYAKGLEAHIMGTWETLQLDDRENTHKDYAYKCVGAAFCALRRAEELNRQHDPDPFRAVIREVIMEAGNASANAAAAGALIGAYLGADSIPNSWLNFNDQSLLVVHQNEGLVQSLSESVD